MVSNRLKRYSSLCLLMTCFFNNYYIIKNYDRKCSSKILFSNSSLQNKIKCFIECPSGPYNHKKTVHKYFLRSFFVWCVVFSFLFIVQILKRINQSRMSLFSFWEFYKRIKSCFTAVTSWKFLQYYVALCLRDSFLPILYLSVMVTNIGMSLVTLIWEEFAFIGAGSDTV